MVKKQKNKSVSKKFLYVIVGIQTIIFAVVIALLYFITDIRTANWNLAPTEMVIMTDKAVSGLTREASVLPDTTYQYIPDAKLRFKTIDNAKIVYSYNEKDNESGVGADITISSDTIKQASIAELYQYNQPLLNSNGLQFLERVSGVQNCNKLFVLTYSDGNNSFTDVENYNLQKSFISGDRNLYLWKHKGPLCNIGSNTEMVNGLEQMLLSAELY